MTDQTTRETLERLASLAKIEGALLANRERLRRLAEDFQARRTALRAAGLSIDRERQRLIAQGSRASGPDDAAIARLNATVQDRESERSRLLADFESQLAADEKQRTAIRKEAEELEARLDALAKELPRSLAAAHRALRARQVLDTVARLEQGSCGACGEHLELEDSAKPPLTCEACDRILIDDPTIPRSGPALGNA